MTRKMALFDGRFITSCLWFVSVCFCTISETMHVTTFVLENFFSLDATNIILVMYVLRFACKRIVGN